MAVFVFLLISVFLAVLPLAEASAQASSKPGTAGQVLPEPEASEVRLGYIRAYAPQLALSVLDVPPRDEGVAGASVAISDNNTTGRFLEQKFSLDVVEVKPDSDVLAVFDVMAGKGISTILADLSAVQLLALADAAQAKGIIVFNVGATDDRLREEDCRANVFHTAPTRSMLADGLAQYLIWKQWPRWALVYGSHENDRLFADALRRAAERFGAEIVAEKEFADTGTARRTDSGVVQIQRQMPVFTQGLAEHDILLVADESEVFGTYVPFRTWQPRPVAGTAGLMPSAWHPASEQWGGTQIQNRFLKATGRRMLSKDMSAWTAGRIIGEAATRTRSADPAEIAGFIRSDEFSIAAFKGQKLTFRRWNWQLRQPIFIGDGRSVVSTSPQEGFLHQFSELDTLGIDQPETRCVLK
ncbi:ABC transporter substrate binding protein (PQQ-dependent alcohol dehydrogenase system) [Rhizobium cellulosilyticum]|uniref:ABC transporter substrate binding protein (PQQ-dependent alcohol dehydrogenase system) n=1 Tax=Aliirhizobium cellulosilyticum TaxID=393664 RepID=A0A7W6TK35_9HYPH|nr:ABC transporter substrate binding protein (PQQ-dependent alcohol dehydrogenase system) [Rhizobium cellulosilyticum]MBB4413946.1 ABC transporter substrate binding protein (PQQ-dependent alcohol dehydrogenase system) [Rhizobium cellulosilyticum]MBB4448561.1 ABC transporter substrate binding protein (PQQ-dependent alcohol dehydrogenase system) [Rhizobium cellulosilyticum]